MPGKILYTFLQKPYKLSRKQKLEERKMVPKPSSLVEIVSPPLSIHSSVY
jgi:hypothetical protein